MGSSVTSGRTSRSSISDCLLIIILVHIGKTGHFPAIIKIGKYFYQAVKKETLTFVKTANQLINLSISYCNSNFVKEHKVYQEDKSKWYDKIFYPLIHSKSPVKADLNNYYSYPFSSRRTPLRNTFPANRVTLVVKLVFV